MNEVNALRLASSAQREYGDPTLAARAICSQDSRVRGVCSAVLTRPAVAYSYALPPCQQLFVVSFRALACRYRFCRTYLRT